MFSNDNAIDNRVRVQKSMGVRLGLVITVTSVVNQVIDHDIESHQIIA